MSTSSHLIKRISEILDYSTDGTGRFKFPLGYQSKMIHFPKGKYVAPHRHTKGRIYKIILSGRIQYGVNDGHIVQIFEPGQIAFVEGNTMYDSVTLEEAEMILWELPESEMIEE